ncbi:MAG: hypothetical protein AAFR03_12460 [Pseudomonadota bacterium]
MGIVIGFSLAFIVLAGLDFASTFAALDAGGREGNALAIDVRGEFDIAAAIKLNLLGLVAVLGMASFAVVNRHAIPEPYLHQPWRSFADWLNPGVVFTPFLKRFRGRAAFQFLVLPVAFFAFRTFAIINNLLIAHLGTGPARQLAESLGPQVPTTIVIAILALSVMIPAAMLATFVMAAIERRRRSAKA